MRRNAIILLAGAAALVSACAGGGGAAGSLPAAAFVPVEEGPGAPYVIGPLDQLQIFVWRNPELSTNVSVRPDGRITVPLIEDLAATGKTPTQLADDIEKALATYIQAPIVSVIVSGYNGPFAQQVRIVGQATKPAALPYRANMTLLDAMIAVGGLSQYAAGNKAKLIRHDRDTGEQHEYQLHIADLLKRGDSSANVSLQPGDFTLSEFVVQARQTASMVEQHGTALDHVLQLRRERSSLEGEEQFVWIDAGVDILTVEGVDVAANPCSSACRRFSIAEFWRSSLAISTWAARKSVTRTCVT